MPGFVQAHCAFHSTRYTSQDNREVYPMSANQIETLQLDATDVPVTRELVLLIGALHGARQRFVNESELARRLGLPKPRHAWSRCRELFFGEYARFVKAAGLSSDDKTFEVLMRIELPPELLETDLEELPSRFAFNPMLKHGFGGFRQLAA
jgi:hypothetical protein